MGGNFMIKTVKELIAELEKIENKEMEVAIRTGVYIKNIDAIFECESDGIPFLCLDSNKESL